jgi:hypothetical protein
MFNQMGRSYRGSGTRAPFALAWWFWSIRRNPRHIQQGDRALEEYPAFEEQLRNLQITLVNR